MLCQYQYTVLLMFLWGFFIGFGPLLVCVCVFLVCCCFEKESRGGQGVKFEQNRVLEHKKTWQYVFIAYYIYYIYTSILVTVEVSH